VPVPSLLEFANVDAVKEAFGLPRREALWAIKALRDEPLGLWSAAAAGSKHGAGARRACYDFATGNCVVMRRHADFGRSRRT
jgi:hypothetical protein